MPSREAAIQCCVLLLGLLSVPACAARGPSVSGWRESSSARLRELGVSGHQASEGFAATVESGDPLLSAALRDLAIAPTASQHRRVAERYRELKILDAAFDYFARARTLDPADAEAYKRVWLASGEMLGSPRAVSPTPIAACITRLRRPLPTTHSGPSWGL